MLQIIITNFVFNTYKARVCLIIRLLTNWYRLNCLEGSCQQCGFEKTRIIMECPLEYNDHETVECDTYVDHAKSNAYDAGYCIVAIFLFFCTCCFNGSGLEN